MISTSRDYYRLREQVERQAADKATDQSEKRAHEHLADLYAQLANQPDAPAAREDDITGLPHVITHPHV